ncbi:urea ABC transporter permease subunit UrtB [Alphaproteobacteria bacterium]|nr:urea ABC transporter permease subunit UrtB [Alphaproteobacteria bacterium]
MANSSLATSLCISLSSSISNWRAKTLFLAAMFIASVLNPAILVPNASAQSFEELLAEHAPLIQKSSSRTVAPVLADIVDFGGPVAKDFLLTWQAKEVYFVKETGQFAYVEKQANGDFNLSNVETGAFFATAQKSDIKQIKPNSGVRAKISASLVPFRLASPDAAERAASLDALARDFDASHLPLLVAAIEVESDTALKRRMERAYIFGLIEFGSDEDATAAAIYGLEGDLSLDVRAALNPLLTDTLFVAAQLPHGINLARVIVPGKTTRLSNGGAGRPTFIGGETPELSRAAAYDMMVAAGMAPALVSAEDRNAALVEAVKDGRIAGDDVALLNNEAARNAAYTKLVASGGAAAVIDPAAIKSAVDGAVFYAVYDNPSVKIVTAAKTVLGDIKTKVEMYQMIDLLVDGLSLASICFLAAIGLAITFGVMGVINMAHGEFIMMGAYTGYVVQLFVPNYTLSLVLALPAAFVVTFIAGVIMERLVIRHLYKRPLETLLATFGISIALQQIAKNIFGTQARPLTSPDWLDGALAINDVLAISNIRIAIFMLGLVFLGLIIFVMKRTRFGLDTRAVTQNPAMASSMGINPDRINMLTFGFGSGIAGIAGVAIGLFSKVTSELGSDYIVQSFMTVVVGGVGNIWGTLAGAALIGTLQKGIEWLNPSNTLAAQTYMIIFIILFIQFRPRGIVALKGRAAGD